MPPYSAYCYIIVHAVRFHVWMKLEIPCNGEFEEIKSTFLFFLRFIGYKFPNGLQYAFMQPGINDWTLSNSQIDANGMLMNTFDAIYRLKYSDNSIYGVYNDQKPTGLASENSVYGHMKGRPPWWHIRCSDIPNF